MNVKMIDIGSERIAVVESDNTIIYDGQSALDFAVSVCYGNDCRGVAINKSAMAEDFFKLSTGVAGEVVQKFVNFGYRLAIIGDFSAYTSKPLHDFIYESNRGRYICFVADEEEAVRKLSL